MTKPIKLHPDAPLPEPRKAPVPRKILNAQLQDGYQVFIDYTSSSNIKMIFRPNKANSHQQKFTIRGMTRADLEHLEELLGVVIKELISNA